MKINIVIPTYRELKKQERREYFMCIIALILMGYGGLIGSTVIVVIWTIILILKILSLKLIYFKVKLKDKLKEAYERKSGKKLSRNEFDAILEQI